MNNIFLVDGQAFNVGVEVVKRSASIRDGPNAGTAITGRRWRDVRGTFIDYQLTISAMGMSQTDYDDMYELLTEPVDSHSVTVPYGQGSLRYEAYIETVEDAVEAMDDGTCWGSLTVNFFALEAQRKPS